MLVRGQEHFQRELLVPPVHPKTALTVAPRCTVFVVATQRHVDHWDSTNGHKGGNANLSSLVLLLLLLRSSSSSFFFFFVLLLRSSSSFFFFFVLLRSSFFVLLRSSSSRRITTCVHPLHVYACKAGR